MAEEFLPRLNQFLAEVGMCDMDQLLSPFTDALSAQGSHTVFRYHIVYVCARKRYRRTFSKKRNDLRSLSALRGGLQHD